MCMNLKGCVLAVWVRTCSDIHEQLRIVHVFEQEHK